MSFNLCDTKEEVFEEIKKSINNSTDNILFPYAYFIEIPEKLRNDPDVIIEYFKHTDTNVHVKLFKHIGINLRKDPIFMAELYMIFPNLAEQYPVVSNALISKLIEIKSAKKTVKTNEKYAEVKKDKKPNTNSVVDSFIDKLEPREGTTHYCGFINE